jgi:hypothetical protein
LAAVKYTQEKTKGEGNSDFAHRQETLLTLQKYKISGNVG